MRAVDDTINCARCGGECDTPTVEGLGAESSAICCLCKTEPVDKCATCWDRDDTLDRYRRGEIV